jgi:hypothetical protein
MTFCWFAGMEAWKFFQAIRPPDMNCNYIGSARLPVRLLVLTQKMVSGHVILTNRRLLAVY